MVHVPPWVNILIESNGNLWLMPCLNSRMVSNYVFVHIHRVRFVARSGQRGLSMYRPYPTSQRGHTYPFRPLCPHKINHKLSDQTRKLIGLNLTVDIRRTQLSHCGTPRRMRCVRTVTNLIRIRIANWSVFIFSMSEIAIRRLYVFYKPFLTFCGSPWRQYMLSK